MKIMMGLLESKGLPVSHITATNVLRQIRYWKELGLGYLGVRKQSLTTWTEERAYELYPDYQSKLRSLRAFDFGDLLSDLLHFGGEISSRWRMLRSRGW